MSKVNIVYHASHYCHYCAIFTVDSFNGFSADEIKDKPEYEIEDIACDKCGQLAQFQEWMQQELIDEEM